MSYLLDTNVLSELRRRAPNPGVVDWVGARPAATLYLSVLTLGAIRRGIEAIGEPRRRASLSDWLEAELPRFFTGRILEVGTGVADRWGKLIAAAKRPVPAIEALLAATALHHGLVLVTRNSRDFSGLGVSLENPWTD